MDSDSGNECTLPDVFESRPDGTHAPVLPPGWLDDHAKAVLRVVLRCTDLDVSADVQKGVLDPATALGVLHMIRRQIEALDPVLADQVVPRMTEAACLRLSENSGPL